MSAPSFDDIDHELHATLEHLVRDLGPVELEWLARRARRERREGRIDDAAVAASVDRSTLLIWRPDGRVDHLLNLLDGMTLTQRVRAPLTGRADLWCTVALQPLLNIAAFAEIPLADGSGYVRRAPTGQETLLGPMGWLPPVDRYGIVGLRLREGRLSALTVDEADFPSLIEQEQSRQLLARHYRLERWYAAADPLEFRPAEMVRALALARQEDPDLFRTPSLPLDELLSLSLEDAGDAHDWRHRAAVGNSVSFAISAMPEALHIELSNRAVRYGMSFDQYVVAVLGHLAWRTPFAEDMEPWDDWDPEPSGSVHLLPAVE